MFPRLPGTCNLSTCFWICPGVFFRLEWLQIHQGLSKVSHISDASACLFRWQGADNTHNTHQRPARLQLLSYWSLTVLSLLMQRTERYPSSFKNLWIAKATEVVADKEEGKFTFINWGLLTSDQKSTQLCHWNLLSKAQTKNKTVPSLCLLYS